MLNLPVSKWFRGGVLGVLCVGMTLYSVQTLTTRPRLWIDEAKSIELARNFAAAGHLDIQTAPASFSEVSPLLQSTGFPVTLSLAVVFEIFGFGLATARVVMLIWMIVAVIAFIHLGVRLFGWDRALAAATLLVTFASLYDNGRTVVGEIPGFVFLLTGLYVWLYSEKSHTQYHAGLWWGLAVVTKPSVFGLIIPTIVVVCLVERTSWFRRLAETALGMIPAAIAWIFVVLDHPFARESWDKLASFYANPYSSSSLSGNVTGNLLHFFATPTLVYFGVFFALIAWVRWYEIDMRKRFVIDFTLIYTVFAYIYYLRSPGWLRYIIIAELLILFVLPYAVEVLVQRFFSDPRRTTASVRVAIAGLVLFQGYHLATAAKIYESDSAIKIAAYVNERYPGKSVATFGALDVSVLLDTTDRYTREYFAGIPTIGDNPLLNSGPANPEVLVGVASNPDLVAAADVIAAHYTHDTTLEGAEIFVLK